MSNDGTGAGAPHKTSMSSDWLALIGRLLLAAIFVMSGLAKLADPTGTAGYIASVGVPTPQVALWAAVAIELLGGIAILVGFRTRLFAFALAGFSIAAAALFHNQIGDQTQFIMFFKNVAIAGGFLQIAAFGPGRLSIDRR